MRIAPLAYRQNEAAIRIAFQMFDRDNALGAARLMFAVDTAWRWHAPRREPHREPTRG